MPTLAPIYGVPTHHEATFGPSASPQLIADARDRRTLVVQVLTGTVHLGGPDVSSSNGLVYTAPALFTDTTGGERYAYIPDGASIYVNEIC